MTKEYQYKKWLRVGDSRFLIRASTKAELLEKIEKKRKLEEKKQRAKEVPHDITFQEYAEYCIVRHKDRGRDGTQWTEAVRGRMRKHVYPQIGKLTLDRVTRDRLQDILNAQQGKSWSHCNKLRQELAFVMRQAEEGGLIDKAPVDKLRLPECAKGERRALTAEERKVFLECAEEDSGFRVFELMLYCGCRPQEAWKARGDDISTVEGVHLLHVRGTKTSNADRFVPIPDELYSKIKNTPAKAPIAPNRAGGFHTKSSYRRITEFLKRQMNLRMGALVYRNKLVDDADHPLPLDANFVPYYFRHTYCTDLKRAGVDLRTAQKLMGHADIAITANIYTHMDMSDVLEAGRQINGTTQDALD